MATGWNSYGSGSATTCKLPGCSRPRYKEPYGFTHDFCGRTHADMFKKMSSSSGQGGHFTDGSRKPFSSSQASSTAGRQPLKAIHSFSTPSHIGSLSSNSKEIRFYNRDEPYYEFTNFYRAPIQVDGHTWPTTEHYFQAQKFVGTPYVDVIRKLPSARDAFQFSRDPRVSRWRRSDWESVKDDVMLKALHMKFMQHEKLRRKLLETGDKELVEHTSNDSYWGDGGDGTGRNTLGKLLMQVRKELRAKYGSVSSVVPPQGSSLRRSESFSGSISSHRSYSSLSPKDDSALLSTTPKVHFSSRKRSASYSNLTNIGLAGSSHSRPSASELGYPNSEAWKKSVTFASHTTNHHTIYQPQNSKSKGTSSSSRYLPTLPQYSKPSTSSQYHPKPSTSLLLSFTSSRCKPNPSISLSLSSTTPHSQPSYSKSSLTPTCESASRTVCAVASPMMSRKTYKRPLPANPPPSSSSSASSSRRHTNQSSVDYDILTGRRKY